MADDTKNSQDPARIAAQDLDHESPKKESPPESPPESLEKTSDRVDGGASRSSTEPASRDNEKDESKEGLSKTVDPEAGVGEEKVPPPVKIPRAKRRGLFGQLTLLAEVQEPKHYPRKAKWFITFNVAFAAIAAPMGSAIIFREKPLP